MGHRDMATTQRYADYVPNECEVEMVDERSVNDAIHSAEVKLLGGWGDIVRSWERTR
jgi:hypothetical protein